MRENREKWMELCAKAADEQDPHKLAVLILRINALLEAQERRLIEQAGSIRQNGVMREVDRRYGMNESERHLYLNFGLRNRLPTKKMSR